MRIGVERFRSQVAEGSPDERVDPLRRHLRGRNEGESSFGETRVGQLELAAATDETIGHEQVEVENTRPPPKLLAPVPTCLLLELQAELEQVARLRRSLDKDCRIEKIRLSWTDRGRAIEGGSLPHHEARKLLHAGHSLLKGQLDLAQITPETDHDLHDPTLPQLRHTPSRRSVPFVSEQRRKQAAKLFPAQASLPKEGPGQQLDRRPVPL